MEVINKIDDLTREIYGFCIINNYIVLNTYTLQKKESTKKRTYHNIKTYDRLLKRNSNMDESEVVLNDHIKEQALNSYIKNIKVIKWSEK